MKEHKKLTGSKPKLTCGGEDGDWVIGTRQGFVGQSGLPEHGAVRDTNIYCHESIWVFHLQGKSPYFRTFMADVWVWGSRLTVLPLLHPLTLWVLQVVLLMEHWLCAGHCDISSVCYIHFILTILPMRVDSIIIAVLQKRKLIFKNLINQGQWQMQ